MACALLSSACSTPMSSLEILDYRDGGDARRYRETFDEAFFDVDAQGNMDVVLRRADPGSENPGLDITQVVHIHTVWRSVPGTTVAERTQINATVTYHVIHGNVGASFEGAGSVFFTQSRHRDALEGTIDLAVLIPTRRLGGGSAIFSRAEISGAFYARKNRRKLVRIINDSERLFPRR